MNRKQYTNLFLKWKNNLINENNFLIINNQSIEQHENNFDILLGELIPSLFFIRDQSHVFHWQTFSYSLHNALGEFYEEYLKLLDELMEGIIGAYNIRPVLQQENKLDLKNFTEKSLQEFINFSLNIFTHHLRSLIDENFTEIHNKIDEILEQINILSYKSSLK